MQKDHGKSIPTLVARGHKSCLTRAFTCPGKSTKEEEEEEEYFEAIAYKCKMFVEMLGYKRVALQSDQETAILALQQRVQKAVNVEMVLMNSKRYDSKSNAKKEKAIQVAEGHIRTLMLPTGAHLAKRFPRPSAHPLDGGICRRGDQYI